jgi:hypothetical protein
LILLLLSSAISLIPSVLSDISDAVFLDAQPILEKLLEDLKHVKTLVFL